MNNYISISFLRAIAILSVAVLHLSTSFLQYSGAFDIDYVDTFDSARAVHLMGYKGVYIFFAISAFLITSSIYRLNIAPGSGLFFFKKRLFRIYPPYIASLMIFLLVHLVIGNYSWFELIESLGFSLIFSHDLFTSDWSIINPVAWSLEVEVQFYALISVSIVCISLFFRRKYVNLCLLLVVFSGFSYLLTNFGNRVLFNYFMYFISGVLAAISWFSYSKVLNFIKIRFFFEMVFLSSLALIFIFDDPILISLSLFVVILSGLKASKLESLFSHSVTRYVSKVSYSYYLLHYPMFHFFMILFSVFFDFESFLISSSVVMVIFIPVSMIAVYPFYFCFERNHEIKMGFLEYIRSFFMRSSI